jgi:hypothetical protein
MKRENVVWGIILILLGLGFLVFQFFPDLFGAFSWPWILLIIGGVFIIAGLVGRIGGLMIPGTILLGLGGIFLYQEQTGNWESWAYIWTLIPGFVGLGMFLGGLFDQELGKARGAAFILMIVSAILFAIFGGFFGLEPGILRFWPVALILFGLWILFKALRPAK